MTNLILSNDLIFEYGKKLDIERKCNNQHPDSRKKQNSIYDPPYVIIDDQLEEQHSCIRTIGTNLRQQSQTQDRSNFTIQGKVFLQSFLDAN
jgi:hypothetical protein